MFLKFKNSQLHYEQFGKGDKILFAFHGVAQNHHIFRLFSSQLNEYTIYSFDLFFHGKSKWNENNHSFTKKDWIRAIEQFCVEQKIEKFSLIGFSFGAKSCWTLIEAVPKKIDKVWLLAPAGTIKNFWYEIATQNPIGRFLFKFTISPYLKSLLFFVKIFPFKGKFKTFMQRYISNKELRQRIYGVWLVYRKLKVNHSKVFENQIHPNKIPIQVLLAKKDEVIPYKPLLKLLQKNTKGKNPTIQSFNCSHFSLLEKVHIQKAIKATV